MADDTPSVDNSSTTDQPGTNTGDDSPTYASDHDADTQSPRPGSDDQVVTPDEVKAQQEGVNAALNRVQENHQKYQADEDNLQKELDAIKAEANKDPDKPPVPTALPAPPTQSEKNGIAVAATNILKWGALIGLAYGFRGRGRLRNSIFKLGLGAALEGYYKGNNEQRDRALSAWEKNRQAINDQNREQHQEHMDILRDQKLSLQQKMDVFREQAQLSGNKRAFDAASRADVGGLQKMVTDEIRMQRAMEKQTRDDRKTWYKALGLSGKEGVEYQDWIRSKGGPDVRGKSEDEMYEIEKKYPIHEMLDEQSKEKAQESLKEAGEKAGAEETARLKAKKDFEQGTGSQDQRTQEGLKKAGDILNSLTPLDDGQ